MFSFSKVAILIAILLVFVGYRWGKRKTLERLQPPTTVQAPTPPPAAPKQPSWLSVKVLLVIVIVLLCVAILSSLNLRA